MSCRLFIIKKCLFQSAKHSLMSNTLAEQASKGMEQRKVTTTGPSKTTGLPQEFIVQSRGDILSRDSVSPLSCLLQQYITF
jgi:hypothetical protein